MAGGMDVHENTGDLKAHLHSIYSNKDTSNSAIFFGGHFLSNHWTTFQTEDGKLTH